MELYDLQDKADKLGPAESNLSDEATLEIATSSEAGTSAAERVIDVLCAADGRVEVDGIIERIGPPRISATRVLAAIGELVEGGTVVLTSPLSRITAITFVLSTIEAEKAA